MPRKKRAEAAVEQPLPDSDSPNAPADSATEFDPARLESTQDRLAAAMEAAPVVRASELVKQPDPFAIEEISLSDERDGPKMRLYRNQRFQQVAIQLDEKPDARYTALLRDAGFRWRGDDKVWTKQIDRDARWRTQAEAEKLFREIGNGIRGDRGLDPVAAVGV
jgi:hypothetical protein